MRRKLQYGAFITFDLAGMTGEETVHGS